MGIRFYKPTSPARRGAMVSDFAEITDRKKKPEKALLVPVKKKGGRNFQGKLIIRPTPNPNFRRVDAQIANDAGEPVLSLSTILGRY